MKSCLVILLALFAASGFAGCAKAPAPASVAQDGPEAKSSNDPEHPTDEELPFDQIKDESTDPISGSPFSAPVVEPADAFPNWAWIVLSQNEEGSWGDGSTEINGRTYDPVSITSLSLFVLLEAGHTHMSKEQYGTRSVGTCVEKAHFWLADHPGESAVSKVLRALAMGDLYALTLSKHVRNDAEKALQDLLSDQREDGSWSEDQAIDTLAILAMMAMLEGFPERLVEPAKAAHRCWQRRANEDSLTAAGALAWFILENNRSSQKFQDLFSRRTKSEDWIKDETPLLNWLHSEATYQLDAPHGRHWNSLQGPLKDWMLRTQLGGTDLNREEETARQPSPSRRVVIQAFALLPVTLYFSYRTSVLDARDKPFGDAVSLHDLITGDQPTEAERK